jgi:hypothetical protein
VEGGHVVIGPVHVLQCDVTGELGEGLQQLSQGEIVLLGQCLRILQVAMLDKYFQINENTAEQQVPVGR